MKSITIQYEYNVDGKGAKILQRKAYYTNTKFDDVTITDREIIISGTRGNQNKPEDVLLNTRSILYSQLLKAIVYVYMTSGKHFNPGTTLVTVNGVQKSIQTINPCTKDLDENLVIKKDKCEAVFDVYSRSEDLLIAYIWYIKAIQENEFDSLWKSFNSLYSIISSEKKEHDKLKDMKVYFINNWTEFIRLDNYYSGLTKDSLRKFRVREFILGDFESKSNTKAYAEMVKSFNDYRIAQLFDEVMPYRKDYLVEENLYNEVNSHIQNKIKEHKSDNVDFARFTILKYAYFLRNKYFHAEKSDPVFILANNNESQEMDVIKHIMTLLLSDLLETVDLFM